MITASDLVAGLSRTLLYGLPLVGLTFGILRLFENIPPVARVAAWWLVTMRLVLWIAPLPAVAVPILPAPAPAIAAQVMRASAVAAPLSRQGCGASWWTRCVEQDFSPAHASGVAATRSAQPPRFLVSASTLLLWGCYGRGPGCAPVRFLRAATPGA